MMGLSFLAMNSKIPNSTEPIMVKKGNTSAPKIDSGVDNTFNMCVGFNFLWCECTNGILLNKHP